MNAELIVRNTIKEHGLIPQGSRVVLGLSGGPDSLCLLYVLAELQRVFGFRLEALHLNHLMRGEEAEADVEFLKKTCESLSVPLTVVRCDVYKKAADEGISVEEAGRAARHEALKECAAGDLMALAHNRDDQAETVLMRIMRGTGIHGLAAMEYKRDDGLIRPLLDTPRLEVEKYCIAHGLMPRYDRTNGDPAYTRNRLRLELLPALEQDYNPSIKEVLVRLSQNAREDDDYLALEAEKFINTSLDIRRSGGDTEVSCSVKKLRALHPAVFKRVIKLIFSGIGLTEDIAAVHLNSLHNALERNRGGALIQFPRGYEAVFSKGNVVFRRSL
jgi:tRNA(Ile)-lysidine synthase